MITPAIRAHPTLRTVEVVGLTRHGAFGARLVMEALCMSSYLTKVMSFVWCDVLAVDGASYGLSRRGTVAYNQRLTELRFENTQVWPDTMLRALRSTGVLQHVRAPDGRVFIRPELPVDDNTEWVQS